MTENTIRKESLVSSNYQEDFSKYGNTLDGVVSDNERTKSDLMALQMGISGKSKNQEVVVPVGSELIEQQVVTPITSKDVDELTRKIA